MSDVEDAGTSERPGTPLKPEFDIQEDRLGTFENWARLCKYGRFSEASEVLNVREWLPEVQDRFSIDAEAFNMLLEEGADNEATGFAKQRLSSYQGCRKHIFFIFHQLAMARLEIGKLPSQNRLERLDEIKSNVLTSLNYIQQTSGAQAQSRDIQVHLALSILRMTVLLVRCGIPIPSEFRRPLSQSWAAKLQERFNSVIRGISFYDSLFHEMLANKEYGIANDILLELFKFEPRKAPSLYRDFISACQKHLLSREKHYEKTQSVLALEHQESIEPVLLDLAQASDNMGRHLNYHYPKRGSVFHKSVHSRWMDSALQTGREALSLLSAIEPEIYTSRPYDLYKLREHEIQILGGNENHELDAAKLIRSAAARRDQYVVKQVERCQSDPILGIEPFSLTQTLSGLGVAGLPLMASALHLPRLPRLSQTFSFPFRSNNSFDELYPRLNTVIEIFYQLTFTLVGVGVFLPTTMLLLMAPGYFLLGWAAMVFFFIRYMPNAYHNERILTSKKEFDVPGERWVFLPDALTTNSMVQAEVDLLSSIFRREVLGFRAGTRGVLLDYCEHWLSRFTSMRSRQLELVSKRLTDYCLDSNVHKIVLFAHGSGTISASKALDHLMLTVDSFGTSKIEVFTYGNLAPVFHNPGDRIRTAPDDAIGAVREERVIGRMEHFYICGNGLFDFKIEDLVKNLDVPESSRVFILNDDSGLFLNQHYLSKLYTVDQVDDSQRFYPNAELNAFNFERTITTRKFEWRSVAYRRQRPIRIVMLSRDRIANFPNIMEWGNYGYSLRTGSSTVSARFSKLSRYVGGQQDPFETSGAPLESWEPPFSASLRDDPVNSDIASLGPRLRSGQVKGFRDTK